MVGNGKTVGFAVGEEDGAFVGDAYFGVAQNLACAVVFVFDHTHHRNDISPLFEGAFCGGDLRFSSVDNNQRRK